MLIKEVGIRLTLFICACSYNTSIAEDEAIIADASLGPRRQVAARLLRIEKGILQGAQNGRLVPLL